eukprot:564299-Pyramimonas_sp.AAC.1
MRKHNSVHTCMLDTANVYPPPCLGHGVGVSSGRVPQPLSLSPQPEQSFRDQDPKFSNPKPCRVTPGASRCLSHDCFGPKRAPRRAKRAPSSPQVGPRGPRVAQTSAEETQDRLKTAQEASKRAQEASNTTPRGAQETKIA